ncbi:MAG: pyruvate, phosphate dikinase [Thiotrichales bacterium]|jgi:pyruvate,orthophosphate dikinase|nr:pyruvate, phosphate dikinase [Thiotrichales bacterium]MBT3613720.1 pyruvate, phosphate dikinase [Thiotrichales bacterium]MBT3753094.1 pyruvate, phosphate dikinase [Thiotrichales bacterium]MBT3838274.1 pyruvate, phosphate dikinase [Thiotrichales bacterium]MBT4151685.1 pyruvate, phosphate dikinase [Thiotrichales bacterium]
MTQYLYSFHDGDGKDKQLLGGKGANLCEMTQMGLNVPPGFVITTEGCLDYLSSGTDTHRRRILPEGLMEQVIDSVKRLEKESGKKFGDPANPLLVSVRSGSAQSMPGMMDTILNLGLNADTVKGLSVQTGDPRFSYDAYRRFIQLFGTVALHIPDKPFDTVFSEAKKSNGISSDVDLDADTLKMISGKFINIIEQQIGEPFPRDPMEQLEIAIKAVFGSWMGKRAIDYRREFKITKEMANGTAVNICTMVFGNRGNDSATGVGFTRNPGSGENRLFGEYLTNAQGEDVVAGIRTPKPIQELEQEMPRLYTELIELRYQLEQHYHEVQDFEFTIEQGVLYCLQTRNGKMNTQAMVKTSIDMVEEGLINKKQALLRIAPESLEQMLFPRIDPTAKATPVARGLPASPGAACGKAVFDADRAEQLGGSGKRVILVREETKPDDIHGFFASQGILTSRGGKTSHAAVVARSMGKPCVAGAESIEVDDQKREAIIGKHTIREGDTITLNGSSGGVYLGEVATVEPEFTDDLNILLEWADSEARLEVRANADSPSDGERALKYGAKGVGLCRTERMFNATDRLPIVVDMIIANSLEDRSIALDKLLPIQREDFSALFRVMAPLPVTVRLLDPPIHEFLPSQEQLQNEIKELRQLRSTVAGMNILADSIPDVQKLADPHLVDEAIHYKENMLHKVGTLHEVNPMLGHRGVRLGITFPEIYSMQIRAILEAAATCIQDGIKISPEIMVPQVSTVQELLRIKEYVDKIQPEVESEYGVKLEFKFGTMIEVVRACMRAESLAEVAEFFSFGTNDLTQATFSFSREDAENKFLPMYNENEILHDNPFDVLDKEGVGNLMDLALQWGRKNNPKLKVGICGEHGGHPESISFCNKIGLDYVSCSAPRVPIARLAAAHAVLNN